MAAKAAKPLRARGHLIAEDFLRTSVLPAGAKVAVQGFGNVGLFAAQLPISAGQSRRRQRCFRRGFSIGTDEYFRARGIRARPPPASGIRSGRLLAITNEVLLTHATSIFLFLQRWAAY